MITLILVGYILSVLTAPTLIWVAYGVAWAGWFIKVMHGLHKLMKERRED